MRLHLHHLAGGEASHSGGGQHLLQRSCQHGPAQAGLWRPPSQITQGHYAAVGYPGPRFLHPHSERNSHHTGALTESLGLILLT
jgi:hypothetical protein